MNRSLCLPVLVFGLLLFPIRSAFAQTPASSGYVVQPGDTWQALSWRFALRPADLQQMNLHINQQREPTIGSNLLLPTGAPDLRGRLVRVNDGGLLQIAVKYATSPWTIAIRNGVASPYRPLLLRPLFIPGGVQPPREFPFGLVSLELSSPVAQPGQALAFRARASQPISITARVGDRDFDVFNREDNIIGLAATGAFFGHGEPELVVRARGAPLWSQPWRFNEPSWAYQQITLTGSAAAIDQQSIAEERARLFELWSLETPTPAWNAPFQQPVTSYLEVSSTYGARRSYNGGPYRTYHEGVDFSAYGGTPVYAPAAGTVILAETLYVRGNAVIIDHGLGVFTGYYHLSKLSIEAGEPVLAGDLLGEVGTTGLSTGNHLHWDLLVAETWVDAASWLEQDMACWLLGGLGQSCEPGG